MKMYVSIARQLKVSVSSVTHEITQEQAEKIEELILQEKDLKFLKCFPNLKRIKLKPDTRDNGETFDLDISDLENLETLEVIGTNGITNINLNNTPNLHQINISGNKRLEKVNGLDNIDGLRSFRMVDNKSLKEIPDIQALAHIKDIDTVHIDFEWLHSLEEKYGDLDVISQDDAIRKKISFIEKMGRFIFPLEFEKGIEIENKSKEILSQVIDDSMTDLEKICAINTWFVDNVEYDFDVIDERDGMLDGTLDLEGSRMIDNIRANSAYNSLVLNSAVCEGYTNGMKYLLNKAGIEAEKVDCRYWQDEDEEISQYIHPKNSNHSIIRFKTKDGWFYSDPTFDSMEPGKRKFFFKTKNEISDVHGLSIIEMDVESPEVRPEQYSNEVLSKILTEQLRRSRKKEKQANNDKSKDYEEHPETKERADDSPEGWKESIRFNISPEQQQEILDIHRQVKEEFEQKRIENHEDKVESTEHGVK